MLEDTDADDICCFCMFAPPRFPACTALEEPVLQINLNNLCLFVSFIIIIFIINLEVSQLISGV